MLVEGKGFFIWKIPYCEGGENKAIANLAQKAGLSHVLIKIANGILGYNIDSEKNDLVIPLVKALKSRNIQAWGWHYLYGDNPIGEANKAIQRIRETGVSLYVIDVEGEFKKPGKSQAAVKFMNRLRSELPSMPVALSSYRYPSYHPQIPWRQFLEGCDYAMPQVYWQLSHNPGEQLKRSLDEYTSMQPYRPVFPTGSAYKAGNWAVSPEDVVEFLDTAKSLHLEGANFWEWAHTRKYLPEVWEAISDYTWFEKPPPVDIAQTLLSTLNTHDPERVVGLYTPTAVHVNARRTISGAEGLNAWYRSLFNYYLPGGKYTLTNYTASDNVRHLTWTASSDRGDVEDGEDPFVLFGDKIAYHYTYFTVT